MPTRNLVVTDHQERLIRELVESGRYQNASEVMRDSLRLMERRMREEEARIEGLRRAVAVAEDEIERGEVADYHPSMFDEIDDEIDRS